MIKQIIMYSLLMMSVVPVAYGMDHFTVGKDPQKSITTRNELLIMMDAKDIALHRTDIQADSHLTTRNRLPKDIGDTVLTGLLADIEDPDKSGWTQLMIDRPKIYEFAQQHKMSLTEVQKAITLLRETPIDPTLMAQMAHDIHNTNENNQTPDYLSKGYAAIQEEDPEAFLLNGMSFLKALHDHQSKQPVLLPHQESHQNILDNHIKLQNRYMLYYKIGIGLMTAIQLLVAGGWTTYTRFAPAGNHTTA
ncbi:MAG TPA: hypothetical protein VLB80_00610 [Candidatus Babeliales bacterium]|nr:hypothetical protein [Candidatus Babeliales bacterium]